MLVGKMLAFKIDILIDIAKRNIFVAVYII